jgi:hypothetical protein
MSFSGGKLRIPVIVAYRKNSNSHILIAVIRAAITNGITLLQLFDDLTLAFLADCWLELREGPNKSLAEIRASDKGHSP